MRRGRTRDKRDKALVVLFAETGMRASELLGLTVGIWTCPPAPRMSSWQGRQGTTGEVLGLHCRRAGRYLRARRAAGNPADRGPLWVRREGALGYSGLVYTLKLRAQIAGVKGFHVHRLRH